MSTLLLSLTVLAVSAADAPPISLHPDNPHYFLFRGRPRVLITSAEHYGAVLNLDFDFVPYLDELQACGLNYTRIFTGAYCEQPGAFNIQHNTLAPATGRLICPWARSETPGYANGGNRFDLERWDDACFRRLRRFCAEAGRRGIVVEVTLFCPFYDDAMWDLSPMKRTNNVNGVGDVAREEVYTLRHADLTAVQERMTRKVVRELAGFDNVIYEICNEPYFGGVTLEWQARIAEVIAAEEAALEHRHLIAQNIANRSALVQDPHPAVSILNFHYAAPPDAVAQNRHHQRVIGCDETGFQGAGDQLYRAQGWDFILAGGALYNNLDYSFTVDRPDGTQEVTDPTPGGGGRALREQLATLKRFIESFDVLRMGPDDHVVRGGVPQGATARALSEPGRAYAIYLMGGRRADLVLHVPPGNYRVEWVHPRSGEVANPGELLHQGGALKLTSPDYSEDIALRVMRAEG